MLSTRENNVDLLQNLGIVPSSNVTFLKILAKLKSSGTKVIPIPQNKPNGFLASYDQTIKSYNTGEDKKTLSEDHCYIKPRLVDSKPGQSVQISCPRPGYLSKLDERLGTVKSTYGPSFFTRLELEKQSVKSASISQNTQTRVNEKLGASSQCTQPDHMKFETPANTQLFKMRNPDDKLLLGYKPLRGDFDVEYDDEAEDLLCLAGKLNEVCRADTKAKNKSEKEDQKLLKELQLTLVDSYNFRLKERKRRTKIVRDNGLINLLGSQLQTSRLQTSLGRIELKKLSCIRKIVSAEEADLCCASLEAVYDKRAETNKLIYYRTQRGIKTKRSIDIFEKLRIDREDTTERIDIRKLMVPQVMKKKKKSVPIYHYARYRDLSVKEADLCSTLGLLPEFFLETKGSLVSDCHRNKGIPLKRARKLVKIDVNKTRKIYDLLMEEGSIWLPASEDEPANVVALQKRKEKQKKKRSQKRES